MRKSFFFLLFFFALSLTYAQQGLIEKFDPCAEEVSSESQKLFKKAYSFYQDGKFDKAFPILRDLIENESDFASPYFLMFNFKYIKDNAQPGSWRRGYDYFKKNQI